MNQNYRKLALLASMLLILVTALHAQNMSKQLKTESLLTSKKWTCLEVKRAKLERIDFRFEIGNELSLRIDKKYSFKNNDYNFMAGNWKLDGKTLYFFYHADGEEGRVESARYKIQKITPVELRLKKLDRPKGKLVFK